MKAEMYFAREISGIKNNDIRTLTRYILEQVPEMFWKGAASSGGKYHPVTSNGIGGLIIHTRQVYWIADTMIKSQMFNLTDEQKDCILAGSILHDSWKYQYDDSPYTYKFHAKLAHDKIMEICEAQFPMYIGTKWLNNLLACVLAHNGKFTQEYSGEFSIEQKLVHMADYIASKKWNLFDVGVV